MDAITPPYHRSETQIQSKSASRLSKLRHYNEEPGSSIPKLSLDIIPRSSPKLSSPSPASSNFSPKPLRELLHSPSPLKKSKARLAERCIDIVDDAAIEGSGGRKRCKSRCAPSSPRTCRRSRKRMENEDKELQGEEILCKPRKKRNSGRSKKDKSIVVPSVQSSETIQVEGGNFERFGEFVNDLVMWRDVSKSSLWFGFGSLCFLSSCFTKGVKFSTFSFMSQLGFLFLGISFLSNSIRNDTNEITRREFKLTEEDILKAGRLILPAANLAISKTRQVFSGEPDMTLKVLPFFLLGAEYGHLITLWRLSALSFFISFTGPKLYSAYSPQISNKVESLKSRASETWEACAHKKVVSASIVTAFWNFTSVRTRIFAAFLGLVALRYWKQHSNVTIEEEDVVEKKHEQQQSTKETVAEEIESKNFV